MSEVTIGWIRNTMQLGLLGLSENLKLQIERDPMLEILGPARATEFTREGNLVDMLLEAREAVPAH